jgi:2-amino-4-hydroxy-6-hydroxymethyldihydropteridine diphosphokinase
MRVQAFIALGSNLHNPIAQITRAFEQLAALPETQLVRQSSLYYTAPVGYDNQPDFINAAAEISTTLDPLTLLHALLALEAGAGRERPFPNAPRVLDLDLLLYDGRVINTPELTLPHPRMHERGFVLLPLAEIAPELEIPGKGRISELLAACSDHGVEKLA